MLREAMSLRVLAIDDDRKLFELLESYLSGSDIALFHARDGREGLRRLAEAPFDAVLLDVMMPGLDGLDVLRRIREKWNLPVIMLTARGDEADRVVGLELGADDYIAKPFSARELLARLRAVLRRAHPDPPSERLVSGGITLDIAARTAELDGESLDLTGLEFDILLAAAAPRRPRHSAQRALGRGGAERRHGERPHRRRAHLQAQEEARRRPARSVAHPHRARRGLRVFPRAHAMTPRRHFPRRHGPHCGPPRDWRARRAYWRMRGHLQRMIFVWFGVAILFAGLSVAGVLTLSHTEHHPRWLFVVMAGVVLWAVSGLIARRLVWPLRQVVRVAEDIGSGRLESRVEIGPHGHGEVGVLADAINDMADRIQQQMADQRELLAGVSHEIRSPLARLRVLLEIAGERGVDAHALGQMEQEVLEVDSLVGELLASARLDFSALDTRPLDARDVALRALERAGLDAALLDAPPGALALEADATLLSRALANLLDNARKHGGGARALRVREAPGELVFEVDDAGPGFNEADLPRVFESFVRGERGGASSLGLGLSLVRRIAAAHGGRAWAGNRDEGGARVAFSVAR